MQDYGYTYWNSNLKYANCGYKAKFFETAFTTLHGMGANTARLSLFFDGRSAPQFGETRDTYNTVSGLQRPLKQACIHRELIVTLWASNQIPESCENPAFWRPQRLS